jgi:hypothetical protein
MTKVAVALSIFSNGCIIRDIRGNWVYLTGVTTDINDTTATRYSTSGFHISRVLSTSEVPTTVSKTILLDYLRGSLLLRQGSYDIHLSGTTASNTPTSPSYNNQRHKNEYETSVELLPTVEKLKSWGGGVDTVILNTRNFRFNTPKRNPNLHG